MMHSHVWGSHRAKVDGDYFYSFGGIACEGQTHTQTDRQTFVLSIFKHFQSCKRLWKQKLSRTLRFDNTWHLEKFDCSPKHSTISCICLYASYAGSLSKSKVNMCRKERIIDQGNEAHEPNVKSITPLYKRPLCTSSWYFLPDMIERKTKTLHNRLWQTTWFDCIVYFQLYRPTLCNV